MGLVNIVSLCRIRSLDNDEQAIVGNFVFVIRRLAC